ncbi:GPW/gp25 family protein [Paenibacillus sp. P22]|uniref:GPW/gp25 family protein n=1 Tax=Paenibacillus sp. P22 TaxID=483908 RepID=UPI0004352264|nr:GPW/gp25 family protein [Paenibacillus sp. P22]CDN41466.1 GPW/gp25 family protein [Paenibacillus sp. P22]
MTTTLRVDGQMPVDFGASGEAEILQNIATIVSTFQGTVPLGRAFGVDGSAIDQPPEIAKALLAASIIGAITDYEPRARVLQVDFEPQEEPQKLVPLIRLQFIQEGEVME